MADNQTTDDQNTQTTDDQNTQNTNNNNTSVDKLVEQKVADALKDIKGKLDKAYEARDEANRKLAEAEQREKEAKLAQMEADGKALEALQMRYDELVAKNTVLEKRITELTRDNEVATAMADLPFRNEKARKIAQKEIVEGLIQDDKGVWRHKSGVSITDFVEAFSKDDDQSFLFKPKANNGSGSNGTNSTPSNKSNGSLFSMPQEDVLKLAAEGKLPRRNK